VRGDVSCRLEDRSGVEDVGASTRTCACACLCAARANLAYRRRSGSGCSGWDATWIWIELIFGLVNVATENEIEGVRFRQKVEVGQVRHDRMEAQPDLSSKGGKRSS
jgi:hypothetical protein